MSNLTPFLDLLILVVASLIPALLYLSWIRQTERYMTEAWGPLLKAFAFGAFFATIVAAILELILVTVGTAVSQNYPAPEFVFLNGNSSVGVFFLVLVIAPFVEEALKASGVVQRSSDFRVPSDGPVFGASVGLGFGFFETFLYGLGAYLQGGIVAGVGLIIIRSLSSVLLHGSTTAMFGFGLAQSRFNGRSLAPGGYYMLAVVMHAGFNALASLGAIVQLFGFSSPLASDASLIGLVLVIVYAFAAIEHARSVIQQTDFPGAETPHPKFRPPPAKPRNPATNRVR